MAFVALASTSLVFRGRSGKIYQIPITRASSVGFCTFTQDAQTFWFVPEDMQLVDAYIGDAVNATDYLDTYLNGAVKPQMRLMEKGINAATTVPRTAPSSWIRGGSQLSLYHYSA